MKRKIKKAWAVVRMDIEMGDYLSTNTYIDIICIVDTLEEGEKEAQRLNDLYATPTCKYFSKYTRLEEDS